MDAVVVVAAWAASIAVAAWLPPGWRRLDPVSAVPEGSWWPVRPWPWPWRRPARSPEPTASDVAHACELLAVGLEAGQPPRSALRVVAEVARPSARDALVGVLRQIDVGVDEADAWASLGLVTGYEAVARDVSRAVRSGVALADLLRSHARDARRDDLLVAQVRARSLGVMGVLPVVVCFLPSFLLLGVVPVFGGLVGRFFG